MNKENSFPSLRGRLQAVLAIALPLLAAGAVVRFVAVGIFPESMPVWAIALIAVVLGLIAVALTKLMDFSDLIVSAAIILVLSLLLTAVSIKSKENAQRREMKRQQSFSQQYKTIASCVCDSATHSAYSINAYRQFLA